MLRFVLQLRFLNRGHYAVVVDQQSLQLGHVGVDLAVLETYSGRVGVQAFVLRVATFVFAHLQELVRVLGDGLLGLDEMVLELILLARKHVDLGLQFIHKVGLGKAAHDLRDAVTVCVEVAY